MAWEIFDISEIKCLKKKIILVFAIIILTVSVFCSSSPLLAQVQNNGDSVCGICNKPLPNGDYYIVHGVKVCKKCFETTPRCSSCGHYSSKLYLLKGKYFCLQCFEHLKTCSKCGKKSPEIAYLKGSDGVLQPFCMDCINDVENRCALCGKSLVGQKYWLVTNAEGISRKYCEKCKEEGKMCFACNFITWANCKKLSDGRYICAECDRGAMKSQDAYNKAFFDVKNTLESELGSKIKYPFTIHPVDLPTLKSLKKNSSPKQFGLCVIKKAQKTNAAGVTTTTIVSGDIYVLDNLSDERSIGIIAHEVGHAWLGDKTDKKIDPQTNEGFAEWCAYKVLMIKGRYSAAESMTKRDDIYGKGLKEMLRFEARFGKKALLDYLTH